MKTVITGASGLLGHHLINHDYFRKSIGTTFSKYSSTFHNLDLTDEKKANAFFSQNNPDHIIQTVALTDVDECENNIEKSYLLNVKTTKNIVSWINDYSPNTRLTYISTDHVYNTNGPHSENNVNPSNIYSLTKLFGEEVSRQVNNYLILRVNFFGYGMNIKNTLSDWIISNLRKGTRMTLFHDVLFTPLYLEHLTDLIAECTEKQIKGVFNLGASGNGMSKADFAKCIAKVFNLSFDNVDIISVTNSKLKTYRPKDMRMSVTALETALEHNLPTINEGIELMFHRAKGDSNEKLIFN